jgi:hypothetical protein
MLNGLLPFSKLLRLIRDVRTRWNSTIVMRIRALYLQPAIQLFIANYPALRQAGFSIPASGWDFIKYVLDISKVCIWVTDIYGSSTENCICHLAQGYYIIAQHLHKCRNAISTIQDSSFEVVDDYLQLLIEGIQAAEVKLVLYIQKLFCPENRDLILIVTLFWPPSRSNSNIISAHKFKNWDRYLIPNSPGTDFYLQAVICLKQAYLPYWNEYDQNSRRPWGINVLRQNNFDDLLWAFEAQ